MPVRSTTVIDRLDREIDQRLRASQAEIERLEAELLAAKQQRAGVISEALTARWSHSRIGESLGLSKQRVAQLKPREGGEE